MSDPDSDWADPARRRTDWDHDTNQTTATEPGREHADHIPDEHH